MAFLALLTLILFYLSTLATAKHKFAMKLHAFYSSGFYSLYKIAAYWLEYSLVAIWLGGAATFQNLLYPSKLFIICVSFLGYSFLLLKNDFAKNFILRSLSNPLDCFWIFFCYIRSSCSLLLFLSSTWTCRALPFIYLKKLIIFYVLYPIWHQLY